MLHLIKEVRDIGRFNEIVSVLFEEGFDFLIAKLNLGQFVPLGKKLRLKLKKKDDVKPEVRLRKTLERLGPTFIKFGQVLSVRPDLVPMSYSKELEKLQDKVQEFSFDEVKETIEKELGKKLNELFRSFEKEPIASASISQVHRAVLKTGEKVAVKVQRPDVRKIMEIDTEIMFYFARLLEKYSEKLREYRPVKIVSEFKQWTEKELDFRLEARNAKRFYENFRGSKTIYIPKIYDGWTSERVLTLEFIDGIDAHDVKEIKKNKIDFNTVLKNGFNATLKQVFVDGIFHADPHPGNMIVMKSGYLALIDFGIVGYFDEKLKNKSIDLVYGIVENDEELIMETLMSMGMEGSDVNYEELKADISYIIQPLQHSSMKDVKLSRVLEEILDIALKHRLRMPASFVLFGKTIMTLEGIALEYDPEFKIVETTKPFIEKLIIQRKSPVYMWKNFMHEMTKYRKFAEEFPEKADRVLDRLQRGKVKVDIEDTDIKKLSLEMDRSSNRIAYGLLIAALLITSAILINVQKGPTILGIPFLAFFSFIFASMFSLVLFISIVRERFRHW